MRLMVTLQEQEQSALWKLAERERRDPRDQAALIIRADLEKRGLLPADLAPLACPLAPNRNPWGCKMARSLTWVADELARLHADLEAIRARRLAEAAVQRQDAAQSPAQDTDQKGDDD